MKSMNRSLAVFLQFLKRDIYVYSKRARPLLFNYGFMYPLAYSIGYGYIQPNIYFAHADAATQTITFVGNILVPLILTIQVMALDLLFDFDADRFVEYQISVLDSRLVILERILFSSLFSFFLMLPFYPVAKLILANHFYTAHTHWLYTFLILYLGSFCISAYQAFIVCFLKKSSEFDNIWPRFNQVLISLGGFWIPRAIISKFSPLLGYVVLLNPYLYITEGLRQAILGGDQFMPLYVCIGMLSYAILYNIQY